MQAEAVVQTTQGANYIKRLCTHFAHKITVQFDDTSGLAQFAMGQCAMAADATTLRFTATAADAAALTQIQGIIDSHLVRFAFREQLELEWQALN